MTKPVDSHEVVLPLIAATAREDIKNARAYEEQAIRDAAASGLTAYRIAQLTGRSANGVRNIIRRGDPG